MDDLLGRPAANSPKDCSGGRSRLHSLYVLRGIAAIGMTWNPKAKPLIFLGTISYSLYLVHQNIGYVVIREVTEAGGTFWLGVGLAVLVSMLLATLLTFTVERPVMKKLLAAKADYITSRSLLRQPAV